jgi:hypothetical protein
VCLPSIEVSQEQIDQLVAHGYIDAKERGDRYCMAEGAERALRDFLIYLRSGVYAARTRFITRDPRPLRAMCLAAGVARGRLWPDCAFPNHRHWCTAKVDVALTQGSHRAL